MSRRGEANPSLYRAVVDHPDDDAPRLAYADWCEQHGQAERAALIRLQCQAAALPEGDGRRAALESEARQLVVAHGKSWLGGRQTRQGMRWEFLRGFPEGVVFGSFKALQENQEHVFCHPVRRLGFYNLRSIARLAGCPRLAGVAELDLSRCNLGEEELRLLVASPHVRRLAWLQLSSNPLGPGGARLLAGWAALAGVRSLAVARARLGDEGLAALAGGAHLARLSEIDLTANDVGPEGARRLADAACWPALRSLRLGENRLGDAGAAELARARHWEDLAVLELQRNRVGDEGAVALARAGWMGRLTTLRLWSNTVADAGARALAGAGHLGRLRTLLLSSNMIGDGGALALARSAHLTELREIGLYNNAMRPALAQAVQERFSRQDLACLDAALPVPPAINDPPAMPPLRMVGGTADEDGLLRAVVEDPDDDVPRLVYADWLEENGQAQRAELLRLQCDPARVEPSPREKELAQALSAELLAGLGGLVERCTFERGMPRLEVGMRVFQSRAFQELAPDWVRRRRVHGLLLHGTTRHWQKVADSPVLGCVHELVLWHNGLEDAGLAVLARSPHLAGLHTLRVAGGGIRQGLAVLTAAALPRLRRLALPDNRVNLESLHALAAWPQAWRLTTLNLGHNWVSGAEASVVFNSPMLANLRHFEADHGLVSDGGARALAASPHMANLRGLRLDSNRIGPEGARYLAESPHLGQGRLRALSLCGNRIDEGALALADSPVLGGLAVLRLSRTGLGDEAVARLTARLGNRLWLRAW